MSRDLPFGADTLVIPFTRTGSASPRPRASGMSRMRRAGELFRHGVMNSPGSAAGDDQRSSPSQSGPPAAAPAEGFVLYPRKIASKA